MKIRYTTRLLPLLTLAAAACSPPPVMDDGGDAAQADSNVPTDVRADSRPDAVADTGSRPDAAPDVVSMPDAMDDAAADGSTGMDATPDGSTGMDAAPDSLPDSSPDSAPDSAPDALPDAAPDAMPDAGPMCPMPAGSITLPMGSVMGMLSSTGGINTRISCETFSYPTSERIYTLNVTSRTGLILSTDNAATTIDTAVVIRRVCNDIGTEVACDDDGGSGTKSTIRTVLDPGMYSVMVDAFTAAGGPFQLDSSTFTPAANATCATATALTAGTATTGSTANGGSNSSPCDSLESSGQVFYSFSIPANSRVNFAVTATGAQNVRASVTDSCNATTCVGNVTTTAMGTAVNVGASNSTGAARTVIVAISSTGTMDGMFSITPTVSALAANANCAMPTALTVGGASATGDTAIGGSAVMACTGTDSTELFYTVSVPANSRGTVTLTNTGTQTVRARVMDNCTPMSCPTSTTSSSTGATLLLTNASAAARTFIVAVASTSSTTAGQFTIAHTSNTMLAANASCAMPATLASGGMVTGDTTLAGATAACASSDLSQLYYAVSVPANSRGNFTITRAGTNNVRARILDSCTAMTCTTSTATTDGTATPFSIINTTGAAATYIIAVSATVTATGFTLAYTGTNPVATNASCATPTSVAPGGMTTIDTAMGGTRPTSCNTSEGDVLYYSVAVPADSSVTLSLTRSMATNMRMRVLDNCAATVCNASISTSSATPVTTVLSNGSSAAKTFVIAVGASGTSTSTGAATLAVSAASMNGYRVTTTAGMCDDVSAMVAGTSAVTLSSADDGTSTAAALPFAFSYFGAAAMTYNYVISSNGFLQIALPGVTAATSSSSNALIPLGDTPNSIIAPFWDDLVLPSSTTSVRIGTLGTMPNRRFVIEWNNPTPFNGSGTTRFQAKLFETTNVIEFHYCAISDTMITRLTGDSATVGLENADGTAGVLRSFNAANGVSVANAIRFTP